MALPESRVLRCMLANVPALDAFGYKSSFNGPGTTGNALVMLYSMSERRMIAIVESGHLGVMRTGAASGVATRHLARKDAATVGVIGAGVHARSQLEAMTAVRPVKLAKVFSPRKESRETYAREMSEALGIEVTAAASGEAAVAGADIVITATRSAEPVLKGEWLSPGVHINAMGANTAKRRELDDETVLRANRLVVDDLPQAKVESGALMRLADLGRISFANVAELGDVVAGRTHGRIHDADITLFNSLGIAFEDVAFAKLVYDRAVAQGIGTKLAIP
jgi:ornithine cyclodeaminase/alanine dehydrogenase-like protein (mu-crystallin family)